MPQPPPAKKDFKSEITKGKALWTPRPAPTYLVDPYLPVGKLGVMVAYGGTFKTWVLLQMGLSVATGAPWLGHTTARAKALFLDYESGDDETHRRLRGLSPEPVEGIDVWDMPTIYLTDPKFEATLKALIESEGYRLVLIDSLAAGSAGNFSENDSRFAAPLKALKRLASTLKIGVVVLHHTRKLRQSEGKLEDEVDPRMAARGTGAIFAAADTMWLLTQAPDGFVSVLHAKARVGQPADMFHVKLIGTAPEPLTWEVVKEADKKRQIALRACRKVLAVIVESPGLSANKVCEVVGGDKAMRLKQIKTLIDVGLVRRERDGLHPTVLVRDIPPLSNEGVM